MYAEALNVEQASAVTPTVAASTDLLRTVIDASLDHSEGLTAPVPNCSVEQLDMSLWVKRTHAEQQSHDPAQLRLGGIVKTKLSAASARLGGRDVAGGDLVLVGGEGCQDFAFLALRHLEEVQGPTEFRCDFVEFCRGNSKVPVVLLKAERRRAGLGGLELEWPT